ncbi:hypothetical protein Asp14428_07590 [Actinoplanes sp. NBRC 14428]|nr:hypothetical protein Asp14428_07590 [Actinoplanes sp. NBRC 14428]
MAGRGPARVRPPASLTASLTTSWADSRGRLTDRLTGRLADRLTGRLADRLTGPTRGANSRRQLKGRCRPLPSTAAGLGGLVEMDHRILPGPGLVAGRRGG